MRTDGTSSKSVEKAQGLDRETELKRNLRD